jgi:hypothetical protein
MAKAPMNLVRASTKVDHLTTFPQPLTCGGPQHRPPTGGDNSARVICQFVQYSLFDVPKRRLAIALKGDPNGATQTLFDHVVGIKKRELQSPGDLPPDGGFSGTGEAHKTDHAAIAFLTASKAQKTAISTMHLGSTKAATEDRASIKT